MNRRNFIQIGVSASAGALVIDRVVFAQGRDYYGGFKVGLQSYSLRTIPAIEKQIEIIGELGVRYVETYNIPSNTPKERMIELKKMLKDRNITPMACGVVRLTKDEAATHEQFDFAQAMGLYSISADPDPDSFEVVAKLAEEHNVNVAIHPHGPRHRYPGWKAVQTAVEGKSKRIGICMDTGHVSRAGDDVIEGIKALKDRVYGVHLKDLSELSATAQDVPIGQGKLDIPGIFKALREVRFQGIVSLEDEVRSNDVLSSIKQSLDYLKKTLAG